MEREEIFYVGGTLLMPECGNWKHVRECVLCKSGSKSYSILNMICVVPGMWGINDDDEFESGGN